MISLLVGYSSEEHPDQAAKLWAFSWDNPFLVDKDLSWLIERFEATRSNAERTVLLHLISFVFRWENESHVTLLYAAVHRNEMVAHHFGRLFAAVALDSEEARLMKSQYLKLHEGEVEVTAEPQPRPMERMLELLDLSEGGDSSAFWKLTYMMIFREDWAGDGSDYEPDLRALPGWRASDENTKARIRKAAKKYLLEGDPAIHEWLGTDEIYRPALAGYKALYLLVSEGSESITDLPLVVWRVWVPVVLAFPNTGRQEANDIQRTLTTTAYLRAPTEIAAALRSLIVPNDDRKLTAAISGSRLRDVVDKVEHCWDERIANVICEAVGRQDLDAPSLEYLLGKLLDHRAESGRRLAQDRVAMMSCGDEVSVSQAIAAGCALMLYAGDAGWPILWPVIQRDIKFGRSLMNLVVEKAEHRPEPVGPSLTEAHLAEAYSWLVHNYPYSEDPEIHLGFSWGGPTPRRLIARWRDSLLTRLQEFGTQESVKEIKRIIWQFPELDWLRHVLRAAEHNTRRNTWTPPQPDEILLLTSNPKSGLVQSGEQLVRIVIESLADLQARLQNGDVYGLWNEAPTYKPKREVRLAERVERHLRETLTGRGVIANREAVVRRGRTDIRVDAVRKLSGEVYDTISVIIEVKGCWNRQLKKAMKMQLVDKYLSESRCDHGIYLVGWFNCDSWDEQDARKVRSPRWTLPQAKEFFDGQADEMCRQGKQVKAFLLNAAL